ncbi:MAG TPA: nucleotidyltransferase domain-containing protein [archaeon]|nr:nucleotidyltransferase domain-containing protein [archaeon]
MEIKFDILGFFFRNPNTGYTIRNLAKITGINHTTVRKYILYYLKEGLLAKKPTKPFPTFVAQVGSKKYLNLKMYYNFELVRKSVIVEELETVYNYPVIVLFGSFSKAMDDEQSDIDICIITDIKKDMGLEKFEKVLGRKVSIHHFTKKTWGLAKDKNAELVNNIANGITLSGQLEIL